MKSVKLSAAAVALLFVFAAAPLSAQQARDIRIGVFYSQVDMQGDNDFGDGFVTEFDDGSGYGAAVSIPFGRFLSVEGAVFTVRTDATLLFEETAAFDLGTFNLTPVSVGAQFHILGGSRIDPYVGAGGAYVLGDDLLSPDLEAAGLGRIDLEDELGYYINAGVALQITEGFGIVVDGRQYQYEPTSRSSVTGVEQELEITPRVLSAGVRLRF
jgi:outer membrane protein W